MERYIVREPRDPRVTSDYPQGNQAIAFSPTSGNNVMIETMFFGGYGAEFPSTQHVQGFVGMPVRPVPTAFKSNAVPGQGQIVSGIDPRYLAAYADERSVTYVAGQSPQTYGERNSYTHNTSSFTEDYQNRSFVGAERNKPHVFTPQKVSKAPTPITTVRDSPKSIVPENVQASIDRSLIQNKPNVASSPAKPAADVDIVKREFQNPAKIRADKLKTIQKTAPRVFSGPVEKVLKWHKTLQDTGILILYEIVAKCVSVRPGESCAKNLVIRDDSGPAMQIVYYEIDFLLPELKLPCMVRVIGRMMPGTCRLQAFNVRTATGDDVATLPRRAAVATHHVSKICKELDIGL